MRRKSLVPRRPDIVYVSDVCRELGVTESTVKRWIRSGHLAARKVGKAWWIRRQPYEQFKATYILPIEPASERSPDGAASLADNGALPVGVTVGEPYHAFEVAPVEAS